MMRPLDLLDNALAYVLMLALALMLGTCATPAVAAPSPLLLKNMVGKVVEGGTYSKVTLINCRDCVVRGAIVLPPPAANINDQAVRVIGSPGARIERNTVTGRPPVTGVAASSLVLDNTGNVLGLPSGEGIHIESSPGAVITGNIVSKFHQGITFTKFDRLTITGNTLFNFRTSPIAGAAGNDLHITGNGIGASFPWRWGFTPGDHGDAIHLWTQGGDVRGTIVADNVYRQGAGAAIMGIVFQAKDGRFLDTTIARNSVTLGQGQAFVLRGVGGVALDNEMVALATGKAAARFDVHDTLGLALTVAGTTGGPVAVDRRMTAVQRALVKVTP